MPNETEFIVDATIIPRMMVTSAFSNRAEFSTHSLKNRFIVWKQAGWRTMVPFLTGVTHPSSSCGRETLSNVAHVLPRMCIRSASSEDRLREIGLEENRPPRISI